MQNPASESDYPDDLRRRAEEHYRARKTDSAPPVTAEDALALIHELQVHQIELEMQNEELRRAQQEAETLRARYSDLYDFAPIGYFTLDTQGRIKEANLTGSSLLGVARRDLLNQPFLRFLPGASRTKFHAYCKRLLGTDVKQTCELRMVTQAKTTFEAQLEGIAISPGEGGAERLRVALLNISERKKLEEDLRRSESHLRQAQAVAHMGSYELTQRPSEHDYWSVELFRIHGLPVRRPLSFEAYLPRCVHPEDQQRVRRILGQAFLDAKPYDCVYRIFTADGHIRYVHNLGEPVPDEDGKGARIVGTLMDVTSQYPTEEEKQRLRVRAEQR